MKKVKSFIQNSNFRFFSVLATLSLLTAQLGASSASVWNFHQPKLPDELAR